MMSPKAKIPNRSSLQTLVFSFNRDEYRPESILHAYSPVVNLLDS
jgi:hypothetical protein